MSDSDWRTPTGFVVFAVIALAAFGFGAWDTATLLTEQRVRNEQATNTYAQQTVDRIQNECGADLGSLEVRQCLDEIIQAEGDQSPSERDLDAQENMARFTRVMGWTALIGVVLGLGSVILIWRTLRETQRMASDAREIGEKQVRANLSWSDYSVMDVTHWQHGCDTAISLTFSNSGSSPARDVCFDIVDSDELDFSTIENSGGFVPPPQFRDFEEERVRGKTLRFCGASQPVSSHFVFMNREDIATAISKKRFLYLAGWVRYRDDFWTSPDDYRFCRFCLIIQNVKGNPTLLSEPASKSTISLAEHGPDNYST